MEEDIKIIEEFIEYVKGKDEIKFISPTEINAIKNLIAENKKLQNCIHKEYEIGFSQGLYEENKGWEDKVKEKIEEIEKECKDCRFKNLLDCTKHCNFYLTNKVLQELLE